MDDEPRVKCGISWKTPQRNSKLSRISMLELQPALLFLFYSRLGRNVPENSTSASCKHNHACPNDSSNAQQAVYGCIHVACESIRQAGLRGFQWS
eukprot:scaffold96362_cov25-Prasinocladus_malaysianus.AAC.1